MKSEIRKFLDKEGIDYELDRTQRGHIKVKVAGKTVIVAGTPSDHRSLANTKAEIRRAVRGNSTQPEEEASSPTPKRRKHRKKQAARPVSIASPEDLRAERVRGTIVENSVRREDRIFKKERQKPRFLPNLEAEMNTREELTRLKITVQELNSTVQELQKEIRALRRPKEQGKWANGVEMAKKLGVHQSCLSNWIRNGRLPADCFRGLKGMRQYHVGRMKEWYGGR